RTRAPCPAARACAPARRVASESPALDAPLSRDPPAPPRGRNESRARSPPGSSSRPARAEQTSLFESAPHGARNLDGAARVAVDADRLDRSALRELNRSLGSLSGVFDQRPRRSSGNQAPARINTTIGEPLAKVQKPPLSREI